MDNAIIPTTSGLTELSDLIFCLKAGEDLTPDAIRASYEEEVSHLGKFEGEPSYVPYFYELSLHGCGGETRCHCDDREEDDEEEGDSFGRECCCDSSWETFDVDDDDRRIFPDLKGVATVTLFYRSDGFVTEDSTTPVEPTEVNAPLD